MFTSKNSSERDNPVRAVDEGFEMIRQAVTGVIVGWLLCAASVARAAEIAPPIRTVILSNGGPATDTLKAILADSGRFQVRACETTDGISPSLL
jgi:hypothetical protein